MTARCVRPPGPHDPSTAWKPSHSWIRPARDLPPPRPRRWAEHAVSDGGAPEDPGVQVAEHTLRQAVARRTYQRGARSAVVGTGGGTDLVNLGLAG